MRRTVPAAVSAALAAAVAVTGVATASGPAAVVARTQTLRLVSRDTGNSFVDNAPSGDSAGDLAVFTEELLHHGHRYGRGDVQFVETAKGRDRAHDRVLISGAFSTKRGELTASGSARAGAPRITLAVTGGTGAYRGARGYIRSVNTPDGAVSTAHLIGVR